MSLIHIKSNRLWCVCPLCPVLCHSAQRFKWRTTEQTLTVSFLSHPNAHTEVRSAETIGPVLIHVITEKGHGYEPAEVSQDKMHGVVKFDPKTGKQFAVSLVLV